MEKNERGNAVQEAKCRHADAGSHPEKKWMSVAELGELLGLKKTDRYWLLHKGFFESKVVAKKTWINVESFESWYANQVKYHKVNGEEPGKNLRLQSYSVKDLAMMLGIHEHTMYEVIKRDNIRTELVDGWTRVPVESFDSWYAAQEKYRTTEDRGKNAELEAATITMPEMARLLGVPRYQIYGILKSGKTGGILETVMITGKRRISRESFEKFLTSQDKYRLNREGGTQKEQAGAPHKGQPEIVREAQLEKEPEAAEPSGNMEIPLPETCYLTINMAATIAGISRQAVSKALEKGCFTGIKPGGVIRIPRDEFETWLESRKGMVE